jgi:hypothetical protein
MAFSVGLMLAGSRESGACVKNYAKILKKMLLKIKRQKLCQNIVDNVAEKNRQKWRPNIEDVAAK